MTTKHILDTSNALAEECRRLEKELASEREARQRAEAEAKRLSGERHGEWKAKVEAIARAEQAERLTETLRRNLADVQQDASANAHEAESLKASLLQAEREQDEALRALEEAKQQLRHLRASHKAQCDARERAVADNAALLAELESIHNDDPYVVSDATLEKYKHHPGAALLEHVEALVSGIPLLDVGTWRRMVETGSASPALTKAVAAYDALKERKP